MAREIDALTAGIAKAPAKGPEVRAEREQPQRAQDKSATPVPSDTLSLTETSARVKELQQRVAAAPVVDAQRVHEIRQALASGSYEIDPVRVADKLARFEITRGGTP